ncbi:MAG: hypothetical protein VW518_00645 [Burkholderiaceae bacterium]
MARFSVPGKFLKHQDLNGQETLITIDAYQLEEVGQEKEKKWVLYFRELEQGLILNATNGRTICKLYGEEMDDWVGKRITLYTAEVQFGSEMVEAIRVRAKAPL